MSESKRFMAEKLSVVQQSLMGYDFESLSLNDILPIIFKECIKENLTFWFSFVENTAVLNLRDTTHENYELNIRVYTSNSTDCDVLKEKLLVNTFLITPGKVNLQNVAISAQENHENETPIISGDKPVPAHIRKAIDTITAKGIPVNPETIRNHLPLGKMSTSARLECNKYLKQMEDSQ